MLPGLSAASLLAGGLRAPAFRNLAALFDDGAVDGIMIDLTDPTTLFQNANGIGAVVNNGDPIGLALDQHKWAGLTLAAYRDGQPENVPNALVPASWTPSGGTLSSVDDALRITATSASTPSATRSISVESGRWYECSARMKAASGGTANAGVKLGTSSGGAQYVELLLGSSVGVIRRCFCRTTSTTLYIQFVGQGGSGSSCDFDFLSIKEIDGHHATASSTARPTWNGVDATFDGSNDFMTTIDFYFQDHGNFLAMLGVFGAAGSLVTPLGAANTSPSELGYLLVNSLGLVSAQMGTAPPTAVTSVSNSTSSVLAEQDLISGDVFVNGLASTSMASPGAMPDAARGRAVFIGARNNNGSSLGYFEGRIKRIVCGQIKLTDVMSAADFHANLIAA